MASEFGGASQGRTVEHPANGRLLTAPHREPPAQTNASAQTTHEPIIVGETSPRPPTRHPSSPETPMEERGEQANGTDVLAGVAVTEIRAPFASVAAAIQRFDQYREFLPRIVESRTVHRNRAETDVYLRADLPDGLGPLWALVRFRVTRAHNSMRIVGERRDGTLRRFELQIDASAVVGTDTTRVALRILGLPPWPLPSGFLSRQHVRWTGRTLRALQRRIEGSVPTITQSAPGTPANATMAPIAAPSRTH
ncbi:MAG: hypothetical protein Q8Q09_24270 [Deltaproteobacteria bacterium]|nr:hypothetical protein [Deltaproteobacteria bacterium]